jgi:hypothetical protein
MFLIDILMILTLSGCVSVGITCLIGNRCQKLIKTIQAREHHRKNIYSAITPTISDKYVINHKFTSSDERFRNVLIQGQHISRTDPKYDNTTNEILPQYPHGVNNIGPLYTFLDYRFHSPYRFVEINQLYCSYDEKYKNVNLMPYNDALKYFDETYSEHTFFLRQNKFDMVNITKFSLNDNVYFFGLNDGNEFVIEGVGSNLRMIDKLFPIEDTVCGIIALICILLVILSMVMFYIRDKYEYRIICKEYRYPL